jgi:enediyne biosynthesis protein E4
MLAPKVFSRVLLALAAFFIAGGIRMRTLAFGEIKESAAAWFTDVSSHSEIPYRTNNDFTGRKYFPQPMCGGVAAIDYDNDGAVDLFFTNGAKLPELKKTNASFYNCLLRNKGNGTFEDVTDKAGLNGANLGF